MKQASTRKKKSSSIAPLLFYQRLKEGGFILLASLGIYFFIALLTYHQEDVGWSHSGVSPLIHNAAGQTGAWIADFSYSIFGYIAYAFPLTLALAGGYFYRERFTESSPSFLWTLRSMGLCVTIIAGCGLVSLHCIHWGTALPMGAGGLLGGWLHHMLLPHSSYVGSTLLLGALCLAGTTWMTGVSWLALSHRAAIWMRDKFLFLQQRYLAAEDAKFDDAKEDALPLESTKPIKLIKPIKSIKPIKLLPSAMKPSLPLAPSSAALLSSALSLDLLDEPRARAEGYSASQLESLTERVELRLREFGVEAKVVGVLPGPVVTRFELDLAAGVKVSRITSLAKDLARSLSVVSVRVVEIIPGKSVVGLEIPNQQREIVCFREIVSDPAYSEATSPLTLALGKDIAGRPVAVDLSKMPHLLVAGTTGSGKSVGLNAMLLSILYKSTPEAVRLILIDPKMLELAIYDSIPHLLTPVVTDMKDAANALRWCVCEMDRRYQLMAALGVRNLQGYNQKVSTANRANKPILDPLWHPQSQDKPEPLATLPFIVVVVDEFADMIMVVGKKVEELIARIAQKARAAGIHLILATQRPSVDVITGLIKANIPTRIAFQVSSRIDSRTILDQSGAEQLLGHGDMLYLPPGVGVPCRIHGAFVSDEEVHKVTQALRTLGSPTYIENIVQSSSSVLDGMVDEDDRPDELYDKAVAIVTESRKASISLVQRRLKIGYNRAARLIERMEQEGVVSAMSSAGGREVIAPPYNA